jgi:hypothetical protein
MVREEKLISDKMSMSFSLSEGNKFHKTSHCSHIVIGLTTHISQDGRKYWEIRLIFNLQI